MMHILLIHQIFVKPEEGGGTRHYELSRFIGERGNRVTVIASDVDYLSEKKRNKKMEDREGLRIVYSKTFMSFHKNFLSRAIAFLSFSLSSFLNAMRVKDIDIVWGTSPSIFQALSAFIISRIKKAKFVFEVRDLWIDFAKELGLLKNKLVYTLLKKLEKFLYRKADKIIVNSPGFIPYILTSNLQDKIELIPNGVITKNFEVEDGVRMEFRDRYSLSNNFVVMYIGNIGVANDIGTILKAADFLKDYEDIKFVLVGGGIKRDEFKTYVARKRLKNVIFIDTQPKSYIPIVLSAADVCVATLKNIPLFGTTYPNKVFDYMAASKPTILAIDGVMKEVIEESSGGIAVPPGDSEKLKEAVLEYYRNPAKKKLHGECARKYVKEKFEREKIAKKLETVFLRVLSNSKGKGSTSALNPRDLVPCRIPEISVSLMDKKDAKEVAKIHKETIPGFLSSLGLPFLTLLYRNIVDDPSSFVLIFKSRNRIEGFVSASTNIKRFYKKFILRSFFPVLVTLIPSFVRLVILKRILETLSYPVRSKELPDAELLSIAVVEEARGKGVATQLFNALKREMRERKVNRFKVTVGSYNFRANKFYEKVGFKLYTELEVHAGEKSNVWIYSFDRGR